MNSKALTRYLPFAVLAIGVVTALTCTLLFPAVEGLGTKVRVPVFHGALTWVNLVAFAVMGIVAAVYAFTLRTPGYRWVEALRWSSVGAWFIGSGLGLYAAFNTWDFTGSQSSPVEVAMADPRMVAQFLIVLLGLALFAFALVTESRRWLAVADVGFVAVAWTVLMRAVLGPGRALHPDSPVLNSEEIGIKLMFFGIVGGLAIAYAGVVWIVARTRPAHQV